MTNANQLSRAHFVRGAGITLATVAAAAVAAPGQATATTPEHPHVRLIRRYYAAYATGDPAALRPFFAPDIRWTIPGHHPLAGTKTGVDEVLAFFSQLTRAGFRAEPIFLAADGDWVVDLHRGWSTTPAGLDTLWALAFRITRNKISEAVNFAGDQHAADTFFWRHYPLAKLPDRLAGH